MAQIALVIKIHMLLKYTGYLMVSGLRCVLGGVGCGNGSELFEASGVSGAFVGGGSAWGVSCDEPDFVRAVSFR